MTVEYAIRLGDGTFHTGHSEDVGEFVQTWTEFEEAREECFRIRSCGLIPRDETLRNAVVVSREVPPWVAVDGWWSK